MTALNSPSDSGDGVIKSISASSCDDTILITSEPLVLSLDGNSDWVLLQCLLEVASVGLDIVVVSDIYVFVGVCESSALTLSGKVWIRALIDDSLVLGHKPLPSWGHETTLTTIAAAILSTDNTVKRLLFRESFELVESDGIVTLHSGDDSKGPARTASTLVLDRGDLTSGFPVDWLRITLNNWCVGIKLTSIDFVLVAIWHGKTL